MNAASDDLAGVLPPVKPWDDRINSVLPLAGGFRQFLNTLAWILEQCRDGQVDRNTLVDLYATQYEVKLKGASEQIWSLRNCGLLHEGYRRIVPSDPSLRWMETRQPHLIIGTMHANARFVGELLDLLKRPHSLERILSSARGRYGFVKWKQPAPFLARLGWLRCAGFARQLSNGDFQASEAGTAFLRCIELYVPSSDPNPARSRPLPPLPTSDSRPSPPEPPRALTDRTPPGAGNSPPRVPPRNGPTRPPQPSPTRPATSPSRRDAVGEIAARIGKFSREGTRHREFEMAVRDAFDFLGFDARRLNGSGQTDVLLTGLRAPHDAPPGAPQPWFYRVAVDAKASSSGKLADLQVTWTALAMHRQRHGAEFSLLVGPSPRTRLLQLAWDASVAVLAADDLAELCRRHAQVPLPLAAYHRLFSGDGGQPRCGRVDLARIEDSRQGQVRRRELLARVADATAEIVANFGPANQQLVRFKLSEGTSTVSGGPATGSEIDDALRLLASPWLQAAAQVGAETADPHYVPIAPARFVAQRLRWLADAFDNETDDDGASSAESG